MRFLKLGRNAQSGKDTWWMIKAVDAQGCALLMSLEARDLGWYEMPGVFSATQLAQEHSMAILDDICPDKDDRQKLACIDMRFEVKGVHHSFTDQRLAVAYAGVRNFDEFEGEVFAYDAAKGAWEDAKATQAGQLSSKCDPKSQDPAKSLGLDPKPQGMHMDNASAASNSSYCESGLRFAFDGEKLSERFYATRYTGAPHIEVNRVAMRIAVMTAPGALGSMHTYSESGYVTSIKLARALKDLDAAQQEAQEAQRSFDETQENVELKARDNAAAKVEREQQRARDDIERAKEDIAHAGIFGFGKKRKLKEEIASLDAKIEQIAQEAPNREADAVEHALANNADLAAAKQAASDAAAKLERVRAVVHDIDRKLQEMQ